MASTLSMRRATVVLYLLAAIDAVASSGYKWPDPTYEALENLIFSSRLSSLADKCQLRGDEGSSPVAAEWLRFAYHDVATHNIDHGTGGLDGSVHFELNRTENIGNGMQSSQFDFDGISDGLVSKSDVIAAAVVHAVAGCGGPILDFRGGRIDATGPGPDGVPKPDQRIEEHVERFRLQGFNETDMIALVACGHTLGGVNSDDFPEIVAPPKNVSKDGSNVTNVFFDSPNTAYDNHVVTEYLDGTTKNPLVVGAVAANQSDLRIFSRDKNATMKSLKNPSVFKQRCKSVLERMIDTVPKTVRLMNEPITFIKDKVSDTRFVAVNDTTIAFEATYRYTWKAPEPAPSQNRIVRFCWCDRRGSGKNCSGGLGHCAMPGTPQRLEQFLTSDLASRIGINFTHTYFRVPIDPTRSISSFWFEVAEGGSKARKVVNTDGQNFIIKQDELTLRLLDHGGLRAVGVHESIKPKRVAVKSVRNGPFLTQNQTFELELNNTLAPIGGYHFYTTITPFNDMDPFDTGIPLSTTFGDVPIL